MKTQSLTDEHIVREVQQGRVGLFRVIVERYEKKIFSMGMRLFYNRDDSFDYTQEVFLKLYSKIDSYRELAPFKFWLYKLAYRHGLNMKKNDSQGVVSQYNEMYIEDWQSEPGRMNRIKRVREVLLDAIEKLPERYRICLDLYFFMGLKYSEISEITGFPINTIKSDVLRAKNILRQTLKGTEAEVYNEM